MTASTQQQQFDDDFETYGYPTLDDVESLDRYRPGGLHPVLLGDSLGGGDRFEVVHKLGHGGFATVWLCYDRWEKTWKAVKILAADSSDEVESSEMFILNHFDGVTDEELERNHICLPRELFFINGPNGCHLCIVMPVLGDSVEGIWEEHGHNPRFLRRICLQLAEAMKFIHDKGVCHGDFRPRNILLKLKDIAKLNHEQMMTIVPDSGRIHVSPIPNPVYPEGPGPHLPEYVYPSAALCPTPEMLSEDVAVSDFGEAYHIKEGRWTTGIPRKYAAPEVVLRSYDLGFGADLWALAATICEVRQGSPPFDDAGLVQYTENIEQLLGPLPEPYRSVWFEKSLQSNVRELPLASETSSTEPASMTPAYFAARRQERLAEKGYESLLETIVRRKRGFYKEIQPGEILAAHDVDQREGWKHIEYQTPPEEADQLLDLLFKIFKYDPAERLSISKVLAHPWFEGEGHVKQKISEAMECDPTYTEPLNTHRSEDVGEKISDQQTPANVDAEVMQAEASVTPTAVPEASGHDGQDTVHGAEVVHQEEEPAQRRNGLLCWIVWVVKSIFPRMYRGSMLMRELYLHRAYHGF